MALSYTNNVNHLGNVLVTLTDKQRGIDAGSNGSLDYYLATVQTATHYYPFGWELVGMQYGAGYRYGYNGMEKSPEIGSGHHTTFFRENDSRSPRWWSIDPKTTAGESPYVMMGGNPVVGTDVLGDTTRFFNMKGKLLYTFYDNLSNEDHFIHGVSNFPQKVKDDISDAIGENERAAIARNNSTFYIGAETRSQMQKFHKDAEEEVGEGGIVRDDGPPTYGYEHFGILTYTKENRQLQIEDVSYRMPASNATRNQLDGTRTQTGCILNTTQANAIIAKCKQENKIIVMDIHSHVFASLVASKSGALEQNAYQKALISAKDPKVLLDASPADSYGSTLQHKLKYRVSIVTAPKGYTIYTTGISETLQESYYEQKSNYSGGKLFDSHESD